jgi:DNA replication and repair protein RecF
MFGAVSLKTMSPYGPTDQLDVWDEQLSRHAEKIDYLRSKVLEVLQEHFSKLLQNLLPGIAVSLSYRRGWDQSAGLGTALKKNRDTDISRSFTSVGAHRMDVRISVSNKAAIEVLSRGQLKLVTMALYLAQVKALFLMTGKKSVVMVDDVSAELDSANTSRVFATLDEVGSQIICTTLDLEQTIKSINTSREVRVFHVEQGHIQEDKTSIQSLSNTDTE